MAQKRPKTSRVSRKRIIQFANFIHFHLASIYKMMNVNDAFPLLPVEDLEKAYQSYLGSYGRQVSNSLFANAISVFLFYISELNDEKLNQDLIELMKK